MRKLRDLLELLLFFLLTTALYCFFLLNLPLFQEPHGLLITNELSDFSSTQFVAYFLFASVVICALQGVFMMKWLPTFTAGMASNLWATTFFLLWVDSMFTLSIQTQTFRFLAFLALGLLFLYLFFFILHYFDPEKELALKPGEVGISRYVMMDYWIGAWMFFYFVVSIRLLMTSYGQPEFQWPLAIGFCALCFLNYLLFLFLRKSRGMDVGRLSQAGRIFFGLWLAGLVFSEMSRKWIH